MLCRFVVVALSLLLVHVALHGASAQEPYSKGSGRVAGSVQRDAIASGAEGPRVIRSNTMFDPSLGGPVFERDTSGRLDARDLDGVKLRNMGSAEARQALERSNGLPTVNPDGSFNFNRNIEEYRTEVTHWAWSAPLYLLGTATALWLVGGVTASAHSPRRIQLAAQVVAARLERAKRKIVEAMPMALGLLLVMACLHGIGSGLWGASADREPHRTVSSYRR